MNVAEILSRAYKEEGRVLVMNKMKGITTVFSAAFVTIATSIAIPNTSAKAYPSQCGQSIFEQANCIIQNTIRDATRNEQPSQEIRERPTPTAPSTGQIAPNEDLPPYDTSPATRTTDQKLGSGSELNMLVGPEGPNPGLNDPAALDNALDSRLVTLREDIRRWANYYRCDGITPTKSPKQCGDSDGGRGEGDSVLFSSILCYSGESWACTSIRRSMDSQGGMWRSPIRLKNRVEPKPGDRFSFDMALGVLLYIVTEHNYGSKSLAREFANRWSNWMGSHLNGVNHFKVCPVIRLTDLDYCDLELPLAGREAIVRHVFNYVGVASPERKRSLPFLPGLPFLPLGNYRLGDGTKPHEVGYQGIEKLCTKSAVPKEGKPTLDGRGDFHCHLVSVKKLILNESGISDYNPRRPTSFNSNPFFGWNWNGQRSDRFVKEKTLDKCLASHDSYIKEVVASRDRNPSSPDLTPLRNQWQWERADYERNAALQSFGWDCIAMINLALGDRLNNVNAHSRKVVHIAKSGIGGGWGDWNKEQFCPPGMKAVGYTQEVQPAQGGGIDDWSMSNFYLHCSNEDNQNTKIVGSHHYAESFRKTPGTFCPSGMRCGDYSWPRTVKCPKGTWITAFALKVESKQGPGEDDTAGNSAKIRCWGGQELEANNGVHWGDSRWGAWQNSPIPGSYVCGVRSKVERFNEADKTGLNDIELSWCK